MGGSWGNLLTVDGEPADGLIFASGLFDLDAHATGDGLTEHPQLGALGEQDDVHEQAQIPLRLIAVIHELREIQVWGQGNAAPLHHGAAVAAGVLLVGGDVAGERGADIDQRAVGAGPLRLPLDFDESLICGGIEVALGIALTGHSGPPCCTWRSRPPYRTGRSHHRTGYPPDRPAPRSRIWGSGRTHSHRGFRY